jgi:hypothetical protein
LRETVVDANVHEFDPRVTCSNAEESRMEMWWGVLALTVPGLASRAASPAERPYLTFGLPGGEYDTAVLDALPGKQPLIKLSYRPPNYETPVSFFS